MHENANKRFEFSTLLSYLKIKSNFTEIDQEVVHHLKFLDRL
jgi:prophage maintenance system killer protein